MKSLSIVIVTWNCRKFAAACLSSLSQYLQDPEAEIVVVDNASEDGTPELIRDSFPGVNLIQSKENLGFARANNVGIAKTSGKYICLINPDVEVLGDCVETMRAYLDSHRDVGLLGPRMLGPDRKPARSYMGEPTLWRLLCRALALDTLFPNSKLFGGFLMFYFKGDRIAEVDILNGWFWMTRRDALDDVGGLDEKLFMYGDDLDWSKRFRIRGWRVVFLPDADGIHYGGGTTARAPVRFAVEMQRANYQYWEKYHGPMSRFGYLAVVALHVLIRLSGYLMLELTRRGNRTDVSYKIKASLASLRWLVGLGAESGSKVLAENKPELA